MSAKLKLEVYVASPPTRKCRALLAVLETVVRRHPEQLQLVVFARGAAWSELPSPGFRAAIHKCNVVPLCYVANQFILGAKVERPVPTVEELEAHLLPLLPTEES